MALTTSTDENFYRFDDITVDGENFRVQKNGRAITLTPRAFDVLAFLLKNAGRVVEKQEMFDSLWKDAFVSDNALTKVIKEIRHALEDPADKPRYIETVPKRGYRFIGDLEKDVPEVSEFEKGETVADPENNPDKTLRGIFSKKVLILSVIGLILVATVAVWLLLRQKPAEVSSSRIRTIAVLPFKPLNDDSRDESLEMGMAETLITRLGNLRQAAVRPLNAVSKYTDRQQDPVQAGRETQVEAVLDGSIQKAGDRVRVTVRLIDIRNGGTLWAEQFDENFTDIFRVQDSIAERITNALALQLSRQEKEQLAKHLTENPEAYQLYLQGQFLWHRRSDNWLDQSLASYQQALEKDPNFALAHIGLADSYIMLSGHRRITMQEAEDKARPAIMKALEIDNSLAQAHNALAELKYQYEYDWPGAEKEFKTAVELNPNVAWIRQAYGWFLMSAGRFDEASAEMEKAGELDPSSLTVNIGKGRLYYYSRQYDKAIRLYENIIAIEPDERSSYNALSAVYEQKQMYAEAFDAFLKARSLSPELVEQYREVFNTSGWQGVLKKRLERMEERLQEYESDSPSIPAQLYARLGDNDKAFYWLEKTFESQDPTILQLKAEPVYDGLRGDPRYNTLLNRIGLQP